MKDPVEGCRPMRVQVSWQNYWMLSWQGGWLELWDQYYPKEEEDDG